MTAVPSIAERWSVSDVVEATRTRSPETSPMGQDRQDPLRAFDVPVLPNTALWSASYARRDAQQRWGLESAGASQPDTRAAWRNEPDAEIVRIKPAVVQPSVRFEVLQQWEGTVMDVNEDGFVALLTDKRNPDAALEKTTLSFEEIAEQDAPLVQQGALFDWTIGYLTHPHGQKTTESAIVFRRMPRWSARELERIRSGAEEFSELFSERSE